MTTVHRPFIKNKRMADCTKDLTEVLHKYQDLSLENLSGILITLILDLYMGADHEWK